MKREGYLLLLIFIFFYETLSAQAVNKIQSKIHQLTQHHAFHHAVIGFSLLDAHTGNVIFSNNKEEFHWIILNQTIRWQSVITNQPLFEQLYRRHKKRILDGYAAICSILKYYNMFIMMDWTIFDQFIHSF